MYVRLHLGLAPSSITTEKVSGTKTPSPPLRLGMLVAGSTYVQVLSDWAERVCIARQLSVRPRSGTREGWTVARCVALLLPRVDQACQVSPQSAIDLSGTALVARRLLGLTRLVHRLAAPCPDCDLLALYREDGAAYVRCAACGAAWSEELYVSLARVIAAEYNVSG
jgi:Zn ribbon nucleic-acid-binding protein